MSDAISAFFQLLEGRLGLHPDIVAAGALVLVLALTFLSLYLSSKLRGTREMIEQLGKRLGYEPPYGDGQEIFHQEFRKEIVERGREVKIKHLEQRVADLEAEAKSKDASQAALQQQSKELEEQLQRVSLGNEKAASQASEQAEAHRTAVEQFEHRIYDIEAESIANLDTLQQRSNELEVQLRLASLRSDEVAAQASEQAQTYRATLEQLEQRIREMDAETNANRAANQQRLKELEEQLQQASVRNEKILVQAAGQERGYRTTVLEIEQRMRDLKTANIANLAEHQLRAKELEEQLRQTSLRNEEITAQGTEEARAHRVTVEHLEQRMREMAAESDAGMNTLQQHSKRLDEQLRHASLRIEEHTAQAGEQTHAHRIAVEQFEQRIRDLEVGSNASVAEIRQRSKELEEQLQQANLRNEEVTARAGEQAHAHQIAVEQFEQRIRNMEAESGANLAALQLRAKELEDQLRQVTIEYENEKSTAQQESLEQIAGMEQFEQRSREFQAERDAWESGLKALQARVKELDGQLQQAADRTTEAILAPAPAPQRAAEKAELVADTSDQLLRRAEWITACAVGPIRPLGLVAAEAFAAAAVAADNRNLNARQLLSELAKLRSAYQKPLPSVAEAMTTFDQRAAELLGANLARTADIAESEAMERYQAGFDRSALLVTNMSLALRQQTGTQHGPRTLALQEMRDELLARLGNNGRPSNAAPEFASS